MKINLGKVLMAVDGKPFKQAGITGAVEDWTPALKEVLYQAVTATTDEDLRNRRAGPEKMKLFKLASKIANSEGITDFELDEVALMKKRADMTFNDVQIFGLVSELLEGEKPQPATVRELVAEGKTEEAADQAAGK